MKFGGLDRCQPGKRELVHIFIMGTHFLRQGENYKLVSCVTTLDHCWYLGLAGGKECASDTTLAIKFIHYVAFIRKRQGGNKYLKIFMTC